MAVGVGINRKDPHILLKQFNFYRLNEISKDIEMFLFAIPYKIKKSSLLANILVPKDVQQFV